MKIAKYKKIILKIGVVFLIVIAVLTYFSNTIDNALLPQVKVTEVIFGTIDGSATQEDRFLLPVSAVVSSGDAGTVFAVTADENGESTLNEVDVTVKNSDDLYCEVTSDNLYGGIQVVYSTSKSIADGDRVHIIGEE